MKPIKSATAGITMSLGLFVLGAWLASTLAYSTPVDASSTSQLAIEIQGTRNNTGRVIVMVFNNAKAYRNFDYEEAVAYREVNAVNSILRLKFSNLSPGPHAVVLFHDENEDYEFNMKGDWPLEGYGTSNATDAYDEPSFQKASVASGKVAITMHYLE